MGNQNTSSINWQWGIHTSSEAASTRQMVSWFVRFMPSTGSTRIPVFIWREYSEALKAYFAFSKNPNTATKCRTDCREAFRMPNTDGMNLPSVLHLGMYYVSQIWANRVANVIPRIRQSGLGVVGANFTTSSSVNSDDESSVDSDYE